MAGAGETSKGKMVIMVICFLGAVYKVSSPLLDETKERKAKYKGITKEITAIKTEHTQYSPGWEKDLAKKSKKFQKILPDDVLASDVENFLVDDFMKKHNDIKFISLTPELPKETGVKADIHNPRVFLRAAKFKLSAKMSQATLLPYLEHVDNYPSLSRIRYLNMGVAQEKRSWGIGINLNLELEVFLTPEQWLPEPLKQSKVILTKKERKEDKDWFKPRHILRSVADEDAAEVQKRKHEEIKKAAAEKAKKLAEERRRNWKPTIRFKIQSMMGSGIVVDENIYEEGDVVRGWKITRVDQRNRIIYFSWGKYKKQVKVK